MILLKRYGPFIIVLFLQACIFVIHDDKNTVHADSLTTTDSLKALSPNADSIGADSVKPDSLIAVIDTVKKTAALLPNSTIDTKGVAPQAVVDFAKTLIGIPYRYASIDPKVGFDCSGFVTYVFSHFNILVPRSSIDFTHVGNDVDIVKAKPGDLILFTGTDSTERFVGHMGIIVENINNQLSFIHSTSGKKYGVTITPMSDYYRGRYMKTIRIFPQNY